MIFLLTRTVTSGDTVTFYVTIRPYASELERLLDEEEDFGA